MPSARNPPGDLLPPAYRLRGFALLRQGFFLLTDGQSVSEPLRSVHIRLSSECHDRIQIMADLNGRGIAEFAEALLNEAVMGKFHCLKVAATKISRMGICAADRDGEGRK